MKKKYLKSFGRDTLWRGKKIGLLFVSQNKTQQTAANFGKLGVGFPGSRVNVSPGWKLEEIDCEYKGKKKKTD